MHRSALIAFGDPTISTNKVEVAIRDDEHTQSFRPRRYRFFDS